MRIESVIKPRWMSIKIVHKAFIYNLLNPA